MTVGEYVEKLKELPQDLPVIDCGHEDTFDNGFGPQEVVVDWNRYPDHDYYGPHEYIANGMLPSAKNPKRAVTLR